MAAGLVLAILLACTAPAKHYIVPGYEGAPGVRRVLLCPLNVAVALPSELSSGAGPVYREIEAYLESRGLEVDTLGLAEARALWQQAVFEAKQSGSRDAGSLLAKNLVATTEFDAMVMPSLITRTVRVNDNSGTWHGVRRRVSMVNLPHRGQGVEADIFSKGIAAGGVSGPVLAASLHVMAYLPDGLRVFEGIGGIAFVQEADLRGASEFRWQLRPNPKPLHEPDLLKESLQIAFGAYLPPQSER
jgi:hypothetical protein